MIRLLVAENHASMRDRVVRFLEVEFLVVSSVENGQEAIDAESLTSPDIVILDISMPIMSGIEAAAQLKQRCSKAKVIFLTMHEEPEWIQAALATGALGYVIKRRLASDLRPAIREAMAGRRFISPSLTATLC
ncbi:MAG: response regulator transcription factor [Blastocatellia bacterium]